MMKQRFVIRLGTFVLLALTVGFLLGISEGVSKRGSLLFSGFLLCLFYSGRLLWPRLTQMFSMLLKAGFVSILFGSMPALLIVMVAAAFFSGALIAACVILGLFQILRELIQSILADAAG